MDDFEQQEQECEVLESILGEELFEFKDGKGTIKIKVNLPNECLLIKSDNYNQHKVQYLPEILLEFTFSVKYPSSEAPKYIINCDWLSQTQVEKLCQELDGMFEEGCEVLYDWYVFLKDSTLDHLEVSSTLILQPWEIEAEYKINSRLKRSVNNFSDVIPHILNNNESKKRQEFDNSMFKCLVCFEDKKGSKCIKLLGCDHIYCKNCMKTYLEVNIKDGKVSELICPNVNCKAALTPSQIKELVSTELFERYDRLLLQVTLDKMADVQYCPLKHCQCVVIVKDGEHFGQCPACSFVYCVYCRKTYHGETACKLLSTDLDELIEKYNASSPEMKEFYHKKYGKKRIQRIIEEADISKYLKENCKNCPSCRVQIEKNSGCNHMQCFKCGTHFCWLCENVISHTDPYKHYKQGVGSCGGQLFQGMVPDEGGFY